MAKCRQLGVDSEDNIIEAWNKHCREAVGRVI